MAFATDLNDRFTQRVTGGGPCLDDESFRSEYPRLYTFLSLAKWGSGQERSPGRITLSMGQGVLTASLTETDLAMTAKVDVTSLCELWPALEAALSDGRYVWRTYGKPKIRGLPRLTP